MPRTKPWHHPLNTPTPVSGAITIVDHDPTWSVLFQAERAKIEDALGDSALCIEHIGSTAVPGLAAKPIVDIMLVVADCEAEATYAPALERAGYILRVREPDPTPGTSFTGTEPHRVFKGDVIDLNLHVWSVNSRSVERQRRFRDWLRAHPSDRDRYAAIKHTLAHAGFATVQQYADAKTEFIEDILAASDGIA